VAGDEPAGDAAGGVMVSASVFFIGFKASQIVFKIGECSQRNRPGQSFRWARRVPQESRGHRRRHRRSWPEPAEGIKPARPPRFARRKCAGLNGGGRV